jgi:hypothetical protein
MRRSDPASSLSPTLTLHAEMNPEALQPAIAQPLAAAGRGSGYAADANPRDPRCRSYGARAAAQTRVIEANPAAIGSLSGDLKLELARRLIDSRFGEQQSVAFFVLEQITDYFHPANMRIVGDCVRCLHGWSKVDAFTGGNFLPRLLCRFPDSAIALAEDWNFDPDLWLAAPASPCLHAK